MKTKSLVHKNIRRALAEPDVPEWKQRARARQLEDDARALEALTALTLFTMHPEWEQNRHADEHVHLLESLGFKTKTARRMQQLDRIAARRRKQHRHAAQ